MDACPLQLSSRMNFSVDTLIIKNVKWHHSEIVQIRVRKSKRKEKQECWSWPATATCGSWHETLVNSAKTMICNEDDVGHLHKHLTRIISDLPRYGLLSIGAVTLDLLPMGNLAVTAWVGFTPGGGVLPYVALTGTCGPIGYGFQGVLSWTGYLFHHFLS